MRGKGTCQPIPPTPSIPATLAAQEVFLISLESILRLVTAAWFDSVPGCVTAGPASDLMPPPPFTSLRSQKQAMRLLSH